MSERLDALQKVLWPLAELRVRSYDYVNLGSMAIDAVFGSPKIRKLYGLAAKEGENGRLITWKRHDEDFALQRLDLVEGFEVFNLSVSRLVPGPELHIEDSFMFGNEDIVRGGLSYVFRDVSRVERTERGLVLRGKTDGSMRRDGMGLRQELSTLDDKAQFRRAFLTIGERPEE
jgi:hypothetical protein